MKLAAGLARNWITAATSSGLPMRPIGLPVSIFCNASLMPLKFSKGVSMGPGATALTRIFGPSSRAQDRVSESIAPLVAQ